MQTDTSQNGRLIREYTSLAATYDQRWSSYLDASLSMTLESIGSLPADRILDVACGTGQLLAMLAKRPGDAALFGIDTVPAMLDVASKRIGQRATLREGNAVELPFDNGCFQLITSTNALHYFADAATALQEIRRVISPSGSLVITDWCRDYFWMRLLNRVLPWTSRAHSHTFSSSELEHCLATAGFRVVSVNTKKIDWFWALMTVRSTPV